MLILVLNREDQLESARQLCRYVRQGLANRTMRIVLLGNETLALDEVCWLEQHQASCCLVHTQRRAAINRSVVRRELDTFICLQSERQQRALETALLMSVTRFSRMSEGIDELTRSFACTLSEFCHAALCVQAKPQADLPALLSVCYPELDESPYSLLTDPLQKLIDLAFTQKTPQVQLLPQTLDLAAVDAHLGTTIAGYLAFPLVVYGRVVRVLVCLIPGMAMERVSMQQVEVMSKAAEQLQVLLERRSAENQLKNQYVRLKRTLQALSTTREQLQHTEKMASIGQLAAGIAHEINNPLAYVLGNFRPLDEYVGTMMKMLELHGEFMQAMDQQLEGRGEQLRQTINEFEQQADLTYVCDDIRAIVNESRDGLMRVKDIISDLNSFSRKDSLELASFELSEVVEQTLRILHYELSPAVNLQVTVAEQTIIGHRGFLQQVLTNLIKNAAQAMVQADTEKPCLQLRSRQREGQVVLTVRDNGPGISEANLRRIFEPFYTTKDVGKGTGLGLSVTWNLVQKMGGRLTVASEEGVFTEFCLQLPLQTAPALQPEQEITQ